MDMGIQTRQIREIEPETRDVRDDGSVGYKPTRVFETDATPDRRREKERTIYRAQLSQPPKAGQARLRKFLPDYGPAENYVPRARCNVIRAN